MISVSARGYLPRRVKVNNENVMRKFVYVFMCAAMLVVVGCDDHYNAPQSLRNTFNEQYAGAVDVEWEKKRGYAVVDFRLPGTSMECEAWYTLDGEWVMTEFDIPYDKLPEAVRTSFENGYGVQTPVDDVKRLERNNADTIYFIEATVVVNGYLTDIYLDYSADGKLLRTAVDVEDYDYLSFYL